MSFVNINKKKLYRQKTFELNRFAHTLSCCSLYINSMIEAMIHSVQPSFDTSRTIKAKTSVHPWSKDISLTHSQGSCNPSRPNSLGKKESTQSQPQTGINAGRVGRVSRRLPDADANFTTVDDSPGSQTELGGCLHPGKVTGGGGAMLLRENPLPWPSKHQTRSRRRFIWSRAEAALRWESDSPWIYYPTNLESAALRKSSTVDCCCMGRLPSPQMCGRRFFSQRNPSVNIWVEFTSLVSLFSLRLFFFSGRTWTGRQFLPPAWWKETLWKRPSRWGIVQIEMLPLRLITLNLPTPLNVLQDNPVCSECDQLTS